jgi:hypothetical protein
MEYSTTLPEGILLLILKRLITIYMRFSAHFSMVVSKKNEKRVAEIILYLYYEAKYCKCSLICWKFLNVLQKPIIKT